MLTRYAPGDPQAKISGSKGGKHRAAALSPAQRTLIAIKASRTARGLEPWTSHQIEEFNRGFELGYAAASGWRKDTPKPGV